MKTEEIERLMGLLKEARTSLGDGLHVSLVADLCFSVIVRSRRNTFDDIGPPLILGPILDSFERNLPRKLPGNFSGNFRGRKLPLSFPVYL